VNKEAGALRRYYLLHDWSRHNRRDKGMRHHNRSRDNLLHADLLNTDDLLTHDDALHIATATERLSWLNACQSSHSG